MRAPLLFLAAFCLIASGGAAAQVRPSEGPVGRLALTAAGKVSYNGAAVTLEELAVKLRELSARRGTVWYYRETARGEPPKEATAVMRLVIDQRLPVSMSTKPDYSDVLLPDGTTRPRRAGSSPK